MVINSGSGTSLLCGKPVIDGYISTLECKQPIWPAKKPGSSQSLTLNNLEHIWTSPNSKTGQHGALFGWYLIWSILLARHSWALSFLKAEVQLLPLTDASWLFFSVPKVPLHHSFEVVAGSRLKDWPGHKPSRAPSLEVHLARRQTYQGASFSSSIVTHSNPLLGADFKVELF